MNKVIQKDMQGCEVQCDDGSIIKGKTWYEKSKDKYWYQLPKDNVTGRQYIGQNVVEFETKTSGPRTIGSRLTPEAQAKVIELEAQIKAIKADPANIVKAEKVDPNTLEGLEAAIKRLEAKRAAKLAEQKTAEKAETPIKKTTKK